MAPARRPAARAASGWHHPSPRGTRATGRARGRVRPTMSRRGSAASRVPRTVGKRDSAGPRAVRRQGAAAGCVSPPGPLFRFRVRKLLERLFPLFSGQKCYQVTSWCPDRKPKRSVCFMAAVVNVGGIGSTARSSDKRGEEPALLDVQPFRSALSRTTGAHEHEGSPQVCVRLRAPAQRNVIVIEKPEAPVADDDERDRIVWPDPSPLSGWWAEVMAHRRITRPHSSADPRHN